MTDKTDSKEREAFERAYAEAWHAASSPRKESIDELQYEVSTWREGDSYPDDLPRLRFGWEWWKARASLAAGSEPVAWPTMPPSRGQSPVLFEDGYAEGWAKCLELCKAATAHHSLPEGMVGGWMPIETAPKDGRFLVRDGVWYGEVAAESKLSDVALVQRENGGAFDVCDTDYYSAYIVNPTGWMPLPPTSSADSRKGE